MYGDRNQVWPAGGEADVRLQSSGVLQETQNAPATVIHLRLNSSSQQRHLHQTHHYGHAPVCIQTLGTGVVMYCGLLGHRIDRNHWSLSAPALRMSCESISVTLPLMFIHCVCFQPRPAALHVHLQSLHLLLVSERPQLWAAADGQGQTLRRCSEKVWLQFVFVNSTDFNS